MTWVASDADCIAAQTGAAGVPDATPFGSVSRQAETFRYCRAWGAAAGQVGGHARVGREQARPPGGLDRGAAGYPLRPPDRPAVGRADRPGQAARAAPAAEPHLDRRVLPPVRDFA